MEIPELQKIIFVEDDPEIQDIVTMSLVDIGGFKLDVYSCAKELFLNVFKYRPHLFLLDINLPDMDGFTILKKLRSFPQYSATPVVFITANPFRYEMMDKMDEKVLGTISKPFDAINISENLKILWKNYHINNEIKHC